MGKRKHDIERYLRGEMTAAEMYALEKEALRDPFLSEALEGANQAGSEPFLFDLQQLHATLHQRTRSRSPKIISFWSWSAGIAAGLALLTLCSVFVISLINQKREAATLAMAEKVKPAPEEQPAMMDSAAVTPTAPQPAIAPAGQQQLSQANENVAPGRQRRNPAANTTRQAEQARLESVVQEEPVQQQNQRIVEADLTEVPSNIQPQARTGNAETKPVARVIQGKVSSTEDGAALQGVNVLVKGTSIGTITDAEGNYQIALNDPAQTLMFSFIGLKGVEVSPTGKRELNVEMSPDLAQFSEVVVAGYGAASNTATLRLAEPKGGRNAFQKYLKEKMNYPEQALENKVEGRVTVQFTVDANGQLGEFKILNGIGYGCDDEVIRLIKEGPAWMPSQRNDQPVKEKVKVRLMFDIPN